MNNTKRKIQSFLYSDRNYLLPKPSTLVIVLIAYNFLFLFLVVEPARYLLSDLIFGRINKITFLFPISILATIFLYNLRWQKYKTLSWMFILYIVFQLINIGVLLSVVESFNFFQIIGLIFSFLLILTYSIFYRVGIIRPDFIIQKNFSRKIILFSILVLLIFNVFIGYFFQSSWYIYSFWAITFSSYIGLFFEKIAYVNNIKNITNDIYPYVSNMIGSGKNNEIIEHVGVIFKLSRDELIHTGRGMGNLNIPQQVVYVHFDFLDKKHILVYPIYYLADRKVFINNNPFLLD